MKKICWTKWTLAGIFVVGLLCCWQTVPAAANPPAETQQVTAQADPQDNPAPGDQKPAPAKSTAGSTGKPGTPQDPPKVIETINSNGTTYYSTKHPWEIYLTACTVVLLICMTLILTAIAWRTGFSPDFQKTFVILTVIFAALFLIVAGYSDQQTAPVFSLLGAIIGYVFGRVNVADQIVAGKEIASKQQGPNEDTPSPEAKLAPARQTPPL